MICNLSFSKRRLRQISLTLFPDAQMDSNIEAVEDYKKAAGVCQKNPGLCVSKPFWSDDPVTLLDSMLTVSSFWDGTPLSGVPGW